MWQCNLIIVKNKDAISYMEKMRYNVYHLDSLRGWRSYYSDAKCYLDQLVGSHALTSSESGKYPYELSAQDYTRAVQKENAFWDLVLARQKEEGFSEQFKQVCDLTVKQCQLAQEILLWEDPLETSPIKDENELIKKKQELSVLEALYDEFAKDKILMHAMCYKEEQIYREFYQYPGQWGFHIKEYIYYYTIFLELLKFEPYIYFTYLDEEERKEFKLVNTIQLDDLQIGDLALLCSNDVIKIGRPWGIL